MSCSYFLSLSWASEDSWVLSSSFSVSKALILASSSSWMALYSSIWWIVEEASCNFSSNSLCLSCRFWLIEINNYTCKKYALEWILYLNWIITLCWNYTSTIPLLFLHYSSPSYSPFPSIMFIKTVCYPQNQNKNVAESDLYIWSAL